jgi:hypothetical protein
VSRWLIFAPVAILALFAPSVHAESQQGLQTQYFIIDEIPPIKSDNIYTECGSEVENNINRSYDGEPYLDCTNDLFMVHMAGTIIIPEHNTIEFWLASDDGGTIKIGTHEWGNWNDQGCTWMESGPIDISAGNQLLDLWMYENGGSSCLMLAWNINNQGWSIVPDEAFLTETLWESTTTSTTSTTTTSTIAPSTTVPVEQEPTTTILQTTTTLPLDTTVAEPTTTVPEPETTLPIETIPPETLEAPSTSVDTIPDTTVPDTLPPDTLPDAPETPETVPDTVVDELTPELVQALEDASGGDITLTDEQFANVLDILDNLTDSEAVALIDQILDTAISESQATELASNPDVLDVITESQAQEIFDAIDIGGLLPDEITALVEAVQGAPTQVRNAFETTINIFGDGLGDYVPLGSTIPVDTRRTLIAVAAGAATVAVGSRRNK